MSDPVDRGSRTPFHDAFLGEVAMPPATPQQGGTTFISKHNSRMIGQLHEHHYHYDDTRSGQKVLEWLWPRDVRNLKQTTIHRSSSDARQGSGASWLTTREEYNKWLSGGSLWIRGKVGCGKTVLFSTIVDNIYTLPTDQKGRILIAHYYCRFQNDTSDDLHWILRRWVAQISDPNAPHTCIEALHRACHATFPNREPTLAELQDVIFTILQSSLSASRQGSQVFLLIDALDELSLGDSQIDEVLDFLRHLNELGLKGLSILATSRDRGVIADYLESAFVSVNMDYDEINAEIDLYVTQAIKRIPRLQRQSDELKSAIVSRLKSEGKGMFLWAALQMRILKGLKVVTDGSIRLALSALPLDLDATYRRLFDTIEEVFQERALLMLQWLVVASRPLYIEELVEACAFRAAPTPDLESDRDRLQAHHLFELLQDLIVIEPALDYERLVSGVDRRTYTVSLAHVSLTEFLLISPTSNIGLHKFRFPAKLGHDMVASHCLAYLYHYNIAKNHDEARCLLDYAWYHWEQHISLDDTDVHRGHIRTKALSLVKQLVQVVSGNRDAAHIEALSRSLHWLPSGKLHELLLRLETPFFHPLYEKASEREESSQSLHHGRFRPLDLQESEIRLVHLIPSLSREKPVYCHLEHVNLRTGPEFNAISYVWGGDSDEHVFLDGFPTRVFRSLHHVLKTLSAQKYGEIPVLWIDELCIDQKNSTESVHQILSMDEIFQSAQEVVICAGSATGADEEIFRALNSHASSIQSQSQAPTHRNATDSTLALQGDRIVELLSDRYWTILGTVQQIVLARRGTVLLRPYSFSLELLETLLHVWLTNASLELEFFAHPKLRFLRCTIEIRILYRNGLNLTLSELLCRFSEYRSGSVHNRVYAALALAPETSRLQPAFSPTDSEHYRRVAEITLMREKNLSALAHAKGLRGSLTGPSWLPTYETVASNHVFCTPGPSPYYAGGKIEPYIQMPGDSTLGIRGVLVGYVARLHENQDKTKCQFTTRCGAEGYGPRGTMVEDVVVVFGGGPEPCILRKLDRDEPAWLFVSTCWLGGVMQGEATLSNPKWEMFWIH